MIDKQRADSLSDEQRLEALAERLSDIITLLGEDPQRQGLLKTPLRSAKALMYLTSGYRKDPSAVIRSAMFDHEGSQVVTVRDIEFYSLCEHHILPFFGKVSIAYIPDGKIVGLSKLARIVDIFARRLQVQERLTTQICRYVMEALGAKGVLVKCTAEHLCMKMRGVEKQDSSTVTFDCLGTISTDAALRTQILSML